MVRMKKRGGGKWREEWEGFFRKADAGLEEEKLRRRRRNGGGERTIFIEKSCFLQ
jgi:hypothetical protein